MKREYATMRQTRTSGVFLVALVLGATRIVAGGYLPNYENLTPLERALFEAVNDRDAGQVVPSSRTRRASGRPGTCKADPIKGHRRRS
jgi:hypothetical protein